MKKIFLGGKFGSVIGNYAIVSDKDYKTYSRFNWFAVKRHGRVYAFRGFNGKNHALHNFIKPPPKGKIIDHRDGNSLNNLRRNLRPATYAENGWNRKKNKNNRSGITGVSWSKAARRWIAQIRHENKKLHLGCFSTKEEADKAYRNAERKHRGKFARR